MGFLGWLALAAGIVFVYSAVKGTSPLATTRALLSGEPPPDPVFRIEGASFSGSSPGGVFVGTGGGSLVMPLNGPVTSPYGPRWGTMHHGVDIGAATGTPVKAAGAGQVTRAGWIGGYGNAVYLNHGNGLETRYAHLSEISVARGQTVSQGATVGLVGSTGDSSGPHLHFEVRINGASVDPLTVVGRGVLV